MYRTKKETNAVFSSSSMRRTWHLFAGGGFGGVPACVRGVRHKQCSRVTDTTIASVSEVFIKEVTQVRIPREKKRNSRCGSFVMYFITYITVPRAFPRNIRVFARNSFEQQVRCERMLSACAYPRINVLYCNATHYAEFVVFNFFRRFPSKSECLRARTTSAQQWLPGPELPGLTRWVDVVHLSGIVGNP